MKDFYIDDPEEGISRDTCHPNFNAILSDDFYIDEIDEFSPFGNDEGHDTLKSLEDWYEENAGSELFILDFISKYLLSSWGWDESYLKLLYEYDLEKIKKINKEHKFLLEVLPQTLIAITYGQLKIIGQVDELMVDICKKMIIQQQIITKEKIRVNQIDIGKMFKVVDGVSTRLKEDHSMKSIFYRHLERLEQISQDLNKFPIKKDEW